MTEHIKLFKIRQYLKKFKGINYMSAESSKENNIAINKIIEKELRKFNWGAACFGLLWSIVNRCFKKWFIESLILFSSLVISLYGIYFLICHFNPLQAVLLMPYLIVIPIFISIVLFIYWGIKGNKWAWNSFKNKNIAEFQYIQDPWKMATIVILSFYIIALVLQIIIPTIALKGTSGNMVLKGISKGLSKDKLTNSSLDTKYSKKEYFIDANACKILKEELQNAIKSTKNDSLWFENISKELKKSDKIFSAFSSPFSETIDLYLKSEEGYLGNRIELKVAHNIPCTLEEKNCSIFSKATNNGEYCLIFFDDNGNIEASSKTLKFISKN